MKFFYKNVLVTDTVYSILLYFLISRSINEFKDTLYIVSNGIPKEIRDKLENVIYEHTQTNQYYQSKFDILKLKIKKMLKYNWRYIFAEHYALDHMAFASQYLGFNKYILLEDSPGIFCRLEETIRKGGQISSIHSKRSVKSHIKALFFHGGCWGGAFAQNPFCKKIIITDPRDKKSSLLLEKNVSFVDLKSMWMKKNENDKRYILSFFNLYFSDIEKWKKAKTIILTQPWITDGILNKEEYLNCYLTSIKKYEETGVIIKPHPRDFFDWEKELPGIQIMRTMVPMQLLCLCGLHFDRAITVSSSAVTSFPHDTEIIWLGNEISSTLMKKYGKEEWKP